MEQIGKERFRPNSWIMTGGPSVFGQFCKAQYEWTWVNRQKTPLYVLRFACHPARSPSGGSFNAYMDGHVDAYFGRIDLGEMLNMSRDRIIVSYSVKTIAEGSKLEVAKVICSKKLEMPENADAAWKTLNELLSQEADYE